MTRKRVLVAMSGGVDSSVTAYLLTQQGYDCLGATMLLHGDAAPGACGSGSDADDAAAICARLGFPHEVIDMRETFELIFDSPERGIAPGQAVVAYAGDIVLGGGTVVRAIK